MLDKLFFGENYPIYNVELTDNKINLYIKSKLVNLFKKCYIAFQATKEDFSLVYII